MSLHRTASCQGKHRYPTSAAAREVIVARQKEARAPHQNHHEAKRHSANMTSYQCRHCQGWHIGGGKR